MSEQKQHGWRAFRMTAVLLLPCSLLAQSATAPALHHRGDPSTTDHPIVVKQGRRAIPSIPEEASGEYMLGRPGELVEITLQFGELSGYISRQGDSESDNGTPLTFFFDKTAIHGQELTFTTRQVHGVWYSFRGSIIRGPGKTPAEGGYYLLTGEMIEHDTANQTEARRTVSLKSGPQIG